jgi:isocitrate/isopropylmalate dehydrogenase
MMLNFLGRTEEEQRILAAVEGCLLADEVTPELGGTLTTTQVGDAILARL